MAENIKLDDNDMLALLTTMLALLPSGRNLSLNQYINNVMKIYGMHLPCTIYSIVPWEFNCTQTE